MRRMTVSANPFIDNTDIDEIYTVVSLGTPVTILP